MVADGEDEDFEFFVVVEDVVVGFHAFLFEGDFVGGDEGGGVEVLFEDLECALGLGEVEDGGAVFVEGEG